MALCLAFAAVFISQTPTFKYVYLGYSFSGVLLFSVLLTFDTQLMIRGRHTYVISQEEYILAALAFYLDGINIFLFLLSTATLVLLDSTGLCLTSGVDYSSSATRTFCGCRC